MSFCLRRPYARIAAAAWLLVSALTLSACGYVRVPGFAPGPQVAPPPILAPAAPITPQVVAPEAVINPAANGKVVVAMLLPLTGPSGRQCMFAYAGLMAQGRSAA